MNYEQTCPIPIQQYPNILLAHGGGGKLMNQLISEMFHPVFGDPQAIPHDAAALTLPHHKIAFTTDSYVVNPLFFPGGDIGSMAIYGTVNDLAMSGARPLYLTASFILEEGLPMSTLWEIVQSMQAGAEKANVKIVTGDTKVVDQGKGDGIFINTAGVGVIEHDLDIHARSIQPGDQILLNGDLARHGIAIMAQREGWEFEEAIESDSAPVASKILELLNAGINLHCARDLTRGGLASALNEIATSSGLGITIRETDIPVQDNVAGACEILGLDPLYIANEGRFILFVSPADVEKALSILQDINPEAQVIGEVSSEKKAVVTMKSVMGTTRVVDMLSGEQLPRIC
ncbi:hydrogenase expression/formation protein HypE [Halothece sp. PCC 7418]|uniref:hydrogenase expression/formation protein HypE n=1 Tax=Halothece sp. (strain PCC 7418) TaxID=65093 RepID=UPI0002A07828|nr:hydrogenase expression/formation protein HypE [Halothece sp. PCC 7418]AFZ42790.1 hydrogenase expression/formation protein HypE [Halothece sp. PCC 7418]